MNSNIREIPSLFTIDVEDYYHFFENRGAPPVEEWDSIPNRVEKNFRILLEILNKHEVKATCFFLGYVGKRFPKLVKEAYEAGHDIGAHSMHHSLIFNMTEQQFYEDVLRNKEILENIIGDRVEGFRSPSFSLTDSTPWFYEVLCRAGYTFDSSLFPASRENGGYAGTRKDPHIVETKYGTICEFPITVAPVFSKDICFFGGGYLRLFPRSIIMQMSKKVNKLGLPVLYYLHPREIDPDHPRLKMKPIGYFKSYVNLKTVKPKLDTILSSNKFMTLREYKNILIENCI